MKPPHFLVFVGAGRALANELIALRSQLHDTILVVPALSNSERGLTKPALARALSALVREMKAYSRLVEPARLTVWCYEPTNEIDFNTLWDVFGKSAWIELIPKKFIDKDRPTRLHIQERAPRLLPLTDLIRRSIFNGRKTSPLVLPFRNFKSKHLKSLEEFWYRDHDVDALKRSIDASASSFRQHHRGGSGAHQDNRQLVFKGARDEECHGQPHPVGDAERCFVEGRFRFGAALFPGFHFDVTSNLGTLDCTLYDCQDSPREMWPERRAYINIFPNDHILPMRSQ